MNRPFRNLSEPEQRLARRLLVTRARNRLGRDHFGACALIDTFRHHLLEEDFWPASMSCSEHVNARSDPNGRVSRITYDMAISQQLGCIIPEV